MIYDHAACPKLKSILISRSPKYGLPPHRMTSKAINDIKTFNVADRSEWLDIKKNDTNYANKRKAGVEGYKSYEKEAEAAQ